jgi:hypothetical protein
MKVGSFREISVLIPLLCLLPSCLFYHIEVRPLLILYVVIPYIGFVAYKYYYENDMSYIQ